MSRFLRKALILSFPAWAAAAPAFGQDLTGAYTMIGRRCEGDKKLIPMDDSAQELFFDNDGSVRHTFFRTVYPEPEEGGMTMEEVWERRRKSRIETALRWHEEDKKGHEEACGRSESGDCAPRAREKLYEAWRDKRLAEAEAELAKKEEEEEREFRSFIKDCSMALSGRYTARGGRLAVTPQQITASDGCGASPSYPANLNVNYYFEDGGASLFLEAPPNEKSREYCGSQAIADIYFRR